MRSYSPKHPQNQDNSWIGKVYLICGILLGLGLVWALSGCSTEKEVIKWKERVVYRDTTAWRDTTFYVPIPLESGQVITQAQDTARAETSVAVAESFVDTFGLLHLYLRNKDTVIPYHAAIPHRTIWVEVTTEKEQLKQQIIEVEKPLTWWQRFRLRAFWWLAGFFLLLVLWWTRELWGKFI